MNAMMMPGFQAAGAAGGFGAAGLLSAMQGMTGAASGVSVGGGGGKGVVLVRGFDFGSTIEQINAHMSRAGTVEEVKFVDVGACTVTYSTVAEAQVAVMHLQQTIIAGNTRYIDVALLDPTQFLANHSIDPDQVKKFYAMSVEMQHAVMAKGGLDSARDPTAVLVGRMKKIKAEFAAKGIGGGGPVPGGVGCVLVRGFDFGTSDDQIAVHMSTVGTVINVQKIDDGSACVKYGSSEEAQAAVQNLQQTTIAGNSRFVDIMSMDPEAFIGGHAIDPDKATQFLALPHERQQFIIGKGSLSTARDPTAVLVGRMKAGKGAAAAMGFAAMGAGGPSAGKGSVLVRGFDFGTTDEQIIVHMSQVGTVTNIQYVDDGSRSVTYGSSEEAQAAAAQLQQSMVDGNRRYIDVMIMDPVAFLAEHPIAAEQQMQFLALTPEQQYTVIAKGSLSTARDPTAVLIQRMKGVQDTGKGFGLGSFGPMKGAGKKGGLGSLLGKGPYSGGAMGGKGGGKGQGGKEGKLGMLLKLVEMMGGGNSW